MPGLSSTPTSSTLSARSSCNTETLIISGSVDNALATLAPLTSMSNVTSSMTLVDSTAYDPNALHRPLPPLPFRSSSSTSDSPSSEASSLPTKSCTLAPSPSIPSSILEVDRYTAFPTARRYRTRRASSFSSEGSIEDDPKYRRHARVIPQHWFPHASPRGSVHITADPESDTEAQTIKRWVPIPLRRWFWIPLVSFMAAGAIAFEVALHFSRMNTGWSTKGKFTTEQGFMHYVYTFPPVIISMIFAGLWTWTDVEIRALQPYVDLAQGNAPPHLSLLLNYNRTHPFLVWPISIRNQHWIVAMATLLTILTYGFQPLAAALFNVQDVWWTEPLMNVTNFATIGLNQNENFQDLTSFLTAAGYASADVLYGIGDPRFVHKGYIVGEFELPNVANGTIFANTTAVYSEPHCVSPDPGSLNMVQFPDGSGWQNTASFDGCTFGWNVNKSATNLFGVGPIPDSDQCSKLTSIPQQYRPILFWFFTYQPKAMASISMCRPSLSVWDVSVEVDLATNNLTSVHILSPIPSGTSEPSLAQFSQFSGNVTGWPLYGRAYNGLFFDLNTTDPFVISRMDAIQLALPAAVFQAAVSSKGGLTDAFESGRFVELSDKVYGMYLSLLAKTVYFLDYEQPIEVQVKTIHKRLFLSEVAVHLLSSAMLVLSIVGTIMHIWHRYERHPLRLPHQPGTIASVVAIGAQTGVAEVLAGQKCTEDIERALQGRGYGLHPKTTRLVMEGEEGYETRTREGFDVGGELVALGRSVSETLRMGGRKKKTRREEGLKV